MTDDEMRAGDLLTELTGRDGIIARLSGPDPEPENLVDEWVTIDGFDRLWRVCELDVSEERMDEVVDSGGLVGMSMPSDDDDPYDLLQNTRGYALVTRDKWSR